MPKKTLQVLFVLVIMVISITIAIFVQQLVSESRQNINVPLSDTKLRQCPDEWIDNQMPSTDPNKSKTQYFLLNGERRELEEFDIEWIQKNCNLKKQDVF